MDKNINWEEVENKISLICYRFSNLASWHDDLAQELRIHAYYVSDDYYDLYRKAIDFWRKVKNKQFPEVPYVDLDVLGQSYRDKDDYMYFDEVVDLIKKELDRPGYTKWDTDMLNLAKAILDIILSDIDPRIKDSQTSTGYRVNHYINDRLNLSWVAEEKGVGYKRVVVAMKFLEDVVRGLAAMNKIEIPLEYYEE